MPWYSKQPDLKNNPLYLEPRITANETSLEQRATNIFNYPRIAPEANDNGRFQRMIDKVVNGGVVYLKPNDTYALSTTFALPSYFSLLGNNAKINFSGSAIDLFYTFNKEEIYIENLYVNDTVGTNTMFHAKGERIGTLVNYSKRIELKNVHAANFELALKADYARQWKLDHCIFYSKNGVLILNKSVEINITDTIIYGSVAPFASNYGIKIDCTSGNPLDYPEGIMVSGCTLDNFYRTVWCNNIFVLQITNSYVASRSTGDSAIYFGKGTGTHNQDITISNVVISGKGIKFQPGTASPQRYRATLSNIVFESVNETNILVDNFAQDVHVEGLKVYASSNGIMALCVNNNKHVTFDNVYGNEGCVSGIQVKGVNSQGSRITNANYDGTGNFLYIEQPVYLKNIQASDVYTNELMQKSVNLVKGTYALSASIASITRHIAKGQKGHIIIGGRTSYVGGQPLLQVNVPAGITVPNGAGWNAKFMYIGNSQYLYVSIPFYCTADVTSGAFELVNTSAGGAMDFDYHSYMTFELV